MYPIYTISVISPMPYIQTNSLFHPSHTAQLHEVNVSSPSIYSYDAMQLSEADVNSLHYDATPPHEIWLAQWTKHLVGLSETVIVPYIYVAATVTTPLNINEWQVMEYPNRLLVTFLSLA